MSADVTFFESQPYNTAFDHPDLTVPTSKESIVTSLHLQL